MNAEQIRNELTSRLGPIEQRVAWLREREMAGMGLGLDHQRRLVREITAQLGELRTALDLPASTAPTTASGPFDESLWRG